MMEVKILGRYRIKPARGAGGVCNRKKASKARCAAWLDRIGAALGTLS